MNDLLTHLETRRNQPGSRHFMVCLNIGWKKLKKYYAKTDLNSSYIMVMFLNPHYRHSWFEEHWESDFVTYALIKIGEEYATAKRLYNTDAPKRSLTPPQAQRKDVTSIAAYNTKRSHGQSSTLYDEPTKYKNIEDPPEA
ncbi:hypothetical protein MBLNU13_g07080t1 [Cladosporium sp. NU13]